MVDETAKGLMESLMRFNKLHMKYKPALGLRSSEIFALMTLKLLLEKSPDGVKVGEVGRELNVSAPTASMQLKALEEKDMIIRNHGGQDRRTVLLTLSEKGEKFFKERDEKFLKRVAAISDHLGREDSKKLSELINKTYDFVLTRIKCKENEEND